MLILLSTLTAESGKLTQWVSKALQTVFGWGGLYALPPLILLALGAWFLLSRIEHLPKVNLERIIGLSLLFFNLLTWFELIYQTFLPVSSPSGGGRIGAAIYIFLKSMLGKAGTALVLIAWFLIGLVLLVDLSMADLAAWITKKTAKTHQKIGEDVRQRRAERAEQKLKQN